MYHSLNDYLRFYKKFLLHQWDNVGPREYVIILVTVGVVGFYMMRRAAKL